MGNRRYKNSSHGPRPLAPSPRRPLAPLPSALLALPFALCSLRSIMNAVRAQPLTRLAASSDRDPDQVIFR